MSVVRTEIVLPKDYCQDRGYPFIEFSTPRPLELVERDVYGDEGRFKCALAHAFVGAVEDVRVFGPGYLVTGDGRCLLHGLSHGNYPQFLETQLKGYLVNKVASSVIELEIPDGAPFIDDEVVLLWGNPNFGHWIFTHLHRLALLSYHPELKDKKILVLDRTPERYLSWLARMGIPEDRLVRAQDCSRIARLWVPSVVHYRGHYADMNVHVFPEAVRLFRDAVLRPRKPHAPRGNERERIYVSRAKASWRRVVNEDELMERLEGLNIRRVFMEDLPIDEQIDVVSRAELIVLAAGGASPITMLAPADTCIIEMCLPKFSGIFGSRIWAQILGQRFSRLDVEPVEPDGTRPIHTTTDLDGIVPVDELAELIEAADGN